MSHPFLLSFEPLVTLVGSQATVLLNANVAFLAIPSVDNGDGRVTAAMICSYLSIVTSTGSILLGLLLVRQHRVKSKDTAEEAVRLELTM